MAPTRRAIVLSSLAALHSKAADWNAPPFPNWSPDTVLKLLVDSPWAKPKEVRLTWYPKGEQPVTYKDVPGANATGIASSTARGGSPVGGIGAPKPKLPSHAALILRWASALPVRQAKALYRQREDKRDPLDALDMVEARHPGYALEIFGLPLEAAHKGTGVLESALRAGTVLRTKGGRALRPMRVEARVRGTGSDATVLFDRAEMLSPADREIEIAVNAGLFEFRERFRLAPMVYAGHFEI